MHIVIAQNEHELKKIYMRLKNTALEVGLRVNIDKTKYMHFAKKPSEDTHIEIDGECIQKVDKFKYLGFFISSNSDTSVAINDRVSAANKAFFAHIKLFKSRLLSRDQKMAMYKALIRPILTYSSEVWVLKTKDMDQILRFERKILRTIYGPSRRDDGTYRIRYNHELDTLIRNGNAIRFIKSQRIRWLGHMYRMPKWRAANIAFHRQPIGRRCRGRPNKRWVDEVTADLQKMGITNWKGVVENRSEWRTVVVEAMVCTRL